MKANDDKVITSGQLELMISNVTHFMRQWFEDCQVKRQHEGKKDRGTEFDTSKLTDSAPTPVTPVSGATTGVLNAQVGKSLQARYNFYVKTWNQTADPDTKVRMVEGIHKVKAEAGSKGYGIELADDDPTGTTVQEEANQAVQEEATQAAVPSVPAPKKQAVSPMPVPARKKKAKTPPRVPKKAVARKKK